MGPSGSGKTSLLNCLVGISLPTSGSVEIDGVVITELPASKRSAFRLARIGIVFQFGELLPELTVLQNVALPARLAGVQPRLADQNALGWLQRLHLDSLAHRTPTTLSGGETLRIGVARALAQNPVLVVADEPTGMLDEENTKHVVDLLLTSSRNVGAAVVIATHDPQVAAAADTAVVVSQRQLVLAPDRAAAR
jgi:putative ABC transport system ATP-binding protein